MVNQTSQKSAFWKAFLLTIIIFIIGISIGVFIENKRTANIEAVLLNSEINLLDEQIKANAFQEFNFSCSDSMESAFKFADKIYAEALKLEEYDSSDKFTDILPTYHRRYDLLRVLLWTESAKTRKQCPNEFHTMVYLYDYDSKDMKKKAKHLAMERLLIDFKYNFPDEVLLIPIASNLDIESVNLIMKKYDIKESPAIIVDEERVIKEIPTFEELKNIVFNSNNT